MKDLPTATDACLSYFMLVIFFEEGHICLQARRDYGEQESTLVLLIFGHVNVTLK